MTSAKIRLLPGVFTLETICPKICSVTAQEFKSPLSADVRCSKTSLLKLPHMVDKPKRATKLFQNAHSAMKEKKSVLFCPPTWPPCHVVVKNEGARPTRARVVSLRWLDWIFLGGYLPSLSLNYVGMSKDNEKRLPQLYYIKMKISYDLGFIAIGVAMAT